MDTFIVGGGRERKDAPSVSVVLDLDSLPR